MHLHILVSQRRAALWIGASLAYAHQERRADHYQTAGHAPAGL
ncbi:hypothetical protein [Streptomyces sp. NPDC054865]